MKTGLWDAVRDGDPAVITAGLVLLFAIAFGWWLWRNRRPGRLPPEVLTVAKIQAREARAKAVRAREEHRIQQQIEDARLAAHQHLALKQAIERESAADTEVFPAVGTGAQLADDTDVIPAVPNPRTPRRNRMDARRKPRPRTGAGAAR